MAVPRKQEESPRSEFSTLEPMASPELHRAEKMTKAQWSRCRPLLLPSTQQVDSLAVEHHWRPYQPQCLRYQGRFRAGLQRGPCQTLNLNSHAGDRACCGSKLCETRTTRRFPFCTQQPRTVSISSEIRRQTYRIFLSESKWQLDITIQIPVFRLDAALRT